MTRPDRPFVHVIIPSYNTATLLCRCLDSLRAQQPGPATAIYVVDNASSDDSVERVRQDPQVPFAEQWERNTRRYTC